MIQTGASTRRPLCDSSITSPTFTPSFPAVATLRCAALSQVSLVTGLGSSWSQPLLLNRPSQTVGSGRKTSSRPPADDAAAGGDGLGPSSPFGSAGTAGSFVPSTTPAWTEVR